MGKGKTLSYDPKDYYSFQSMDCVGDVFQRIVTGGYPELFVYAELSIRISIPPMKWGLDILSVWQTV